jgi:hypothetical protein
MNRHYERHFEAKLQAVIRRQVQPFIHNPCLSILTYTGEDLNNKLIFYLL